MTDTVQQFFESLPGRFRADRAEGLDAIYQFDITGDGGGQWHADIAAGACELVPGWAPDPNVVLTCAADAWLAIARGELQPQMAFAGGLLGVKGDISLAMKLETIFLS